MSDLNQSPPPQPGPADQPDKNNASLIRQLVLVAILLIAGGALAYDYLVARPAAQEAFEQVEKLQESDTDRDEVIKKLGEPSTTYNKEGAITIDLYRFRSGLIFRTYKVYVVYTGAGRIESVSKDKEPSQLDLKDVKVSDDSDSDDAPPAVPDTPVPDSGDTSGGGPGFGDPAQFVDRIMENARSGQRPKNNQM